MSHPSRAKGDHPAQRYPAGDGEADAGPATRRAAILIAEGDKRSAILKVEGKAEAYRNVQAAQIEMTARLFEALQASNLSPEALRFLYLKTLLEVAKGPASKLFVVHSKLQSLARTIGILAGSAAIISEDSDEERRLKPNKTEPSPV